MSRDRQRDVLRAALEQIAPVLRAANICGLIEPLGFETSTLRFKQDVVETLHALDMTDCFSLIHDTFHHALSGEQALFAANTQIVHMSGALRRDVPIGALRDADRGLVGPDDRLETCRQVADLKAAGYAGPLSFEAFDPAVHAVPDPAQALAASITFMTSHTAGIAA